MPIDVDAVHGVCALVIVGVCVALEHRNSTVEIDWINFVSGRGALTLCVYHVHCHGFCTNIECFLFRVVIVHGMGSPLVIGPQSPVA